MDYVQQEPWALLPKCPKSLALTILFAKLSQVEGLRHQEGLDKAGVAEVRLNRAHDPLVFLCG